MINDETEAHARGTDPPISWIAARKMRKTTSAERRVIDALLATGVPMTTLCIMRHLHEVLGRPGDSQSWSVSPRMRPLQRKGIIETAGRKTILNSNGKIAELTAWVIKKPRIKPANQEPS